jgi:hypothetical protein
MPRVVRLSGRRVRVNIEQAPALNTAVRAVHEGWKNLITLDSTLAPDERRAVVVREMLHDLDMLCGTDLKEQDVASLASVLFAALRDNPKLVAWLMSKE